MFPYSHILPYTTCSPSQQAQDTSPHPVVETKLLTLHPAPTGALAQTGHRVTCHLSDTWNFPGSKTPVTTVPAMRKLLYPRKKKQKKKCSFSVARDSSSPKPVNRMVWLTESKLGNPKKKRLSDPKNATIGGSSRPRQSERISFIETFFSDSMGVCLRHRKAQILEILETFGRWLVLSSHAKVICLINTFRVSSSLEMEKKSKPPTNMTWYVIIIYDCAAAEASCSMLRMA